LHFSHWKLGFLAAHDPVIPHEPPSRAEALTCRPKKMKNGKISRKMGNNTREQLLHNALALANKTPGPLAPVHNRFSVQWNMEWNFG